MAGFEGGKRNQTKYVFGWLDNHAEGCVALASDHYITNVFSQNYFSYTLW